MTEEALIRGIRNREEGAIDHCMGKYARLLWPIAAAVLKHVGDEQDVEEVVADTFIFLWQHPEKFDPSRGKLKSWLCLVVRSRAIDRYRELNRRAVLPLEEAVLSQSLGLQEELLRQETKRELLAAISALGQPGREILVRRYYHGQKPREIALALGMTVKQVDNSLYRSKRALRKALEGGSL